MTAAYCVRCGTYSEDALLVRVVETGSGPGGMLYACPDCRHQYPGGPGTAAVGLTEWASTRAQADEGEVSA